MRQANLRGWVMRLSSQAGSWLRAAAGRRRLEREMDEELAFHLECRVADLVERGMSPEAAARQARIEFGGVTMHKEEMRASLGLRLWDDLRADIRYAWRMLAKSPVFTAIAIASLALGIGANTAIFTLAKEMLLDRLNVPQSEQLRLLWWRGPQDNIVHGVWGSLMPENGQTISSSFSYPVYRNLQEQSRKQDLFDALFAFKSIGNVTTTVDSRAQVVRGEMVSGDYYSGLGVKPELGRGIAPADDSTAGAGAVVTISDGFWRRAFAASPSAIGKVIAVNGKPFTVIGVNPPEFTGASSAHESPQVFVPFSMQPVVVPQGKGSLLEDTSLWWMQVMVRPKAGVTQARAEAAMSAALAAAVASEHTAKPGEKIPQVLLRDGSRGENEAAQMYRQPVMVLLAVAGLVLLLACANLANLLLARASAREREMAVRLALGAGRARVVRQVLTESLMLSFAGGTAGFALGWVSRDVIPKLMSDPWDPTQLSGRLDWGVLVFTVGLSLVTGLIFGVAPALKATRAQASSGLKDNAATVTRRRTGYAGKGIVVFQVALSTLLVVGAGLFLRTIGNLDHVDPGFRVDHLLLFDINPPEAQYPDEKAVLLHTEIMRRLAAVPGVESVSASELPLIANARMMNSWTALDNPVAQPQDAGLMNVVGDHFLSTMGMPMIAGRELGPQDSKTAETAVVVNQQMAHAVWGRADVLGRHLKVGNKVFTIVGVVKNAAYDSLRKAPQGQFFFAYRQVGFDGLTYEVRTHMGAASLAPALQKAVAGIDPNLPLSAVRTQQEQINATLGDERMFATLTAAFGLLALVLASIGIYGVMAYTVARRTQEIGIRVALGARAGQILNMVLGETSRMTILGVIVGLGAAFGLTRLVKEMLYGVKTYDPVTLAGSAALLCLVALAAALMPARRASKVDPMRALRHE
ncbi:ADOP family duplicated permease [Silvibacterium sp.]|uniref:ABC transporter permease n=1 Tax=Silvibacterium sp. TaxID=1964179 RepID=UPI0039E5F38A